MLICMNITAILTRISRRNSSRVVPPSGNALRPRPLPHPPRLRRQVTPLRRPPAVTQAVRMKIMRIRVSISAICMMDIICPLVEFRSFSG